MELSEAVEILQRTPATLRSLLAGLSGPWLLTNEGGDTFSPRDVVAHLIHGELTDWIPRIRIILEHGATRPFDRFDRFGYQPGPEVTVEQMLDRFDELRRDNLAHLRALALTPEQMALPGTHPELGPVTLGQLIATWAVHDLNHVGQIVRVMSRRVTADVGPWRPYLGILK